MVRRGSEGGSEGEGEARLHWAPLLGEFTQEGDSLIFKGKRFEYEGSIRPSIGNAVCDRRFSGGKISAVFSFASIEPRSACELILHYNPATGAFVTAGLGGAGLFSVRHFFNQWNVIATAGDTANLHPNTDYHVTVDVKGSQITLSVDKVDVLQSQFPIRLPESQVGVWCMSSDEVSVSNYCVQSQCPTVFVVMQFSSPYNEIYSEVIQRVCTDLGVQTHRADETYGPGVIIEDVTQQLIESQAVIAEISPVNANVYYEVGYAHAMGKPTILLADREARLPFDVSPFRVLFYDNSIPGRTRFEEGLRRHIKAIFPR